MTYDRHESTKTPAAARLAISFDPARLAADLASLESYPGFRWIGRGRRAGKPRHLRWDIVSLVQKEGSWEDVTGTGSSLKSYAPTPLLECAPYLREVLDQLRCPKLAVRLSAIHAGGIIQPHRDKVISMEHGWVRLHLPITASDDVHFLLDGEEQRWRNGELWYADFTRLHSVENRGTTSRVHLMIDCVPNDFLVGLFPPGYLSAESLLLHAPVLDRTSAELATYECVFEVERDRVRPLLPPSADRSAMMKGAIALIDGRLVMSIDGKPEFALTPLGDDLFGLREHLPNPAVRLSREGGRVRHLEFAHKILGNVDVVPATILVGSNNPLSM